MRNAALIATSLFALGCSFDTSVPFSAVGMGPDAAVGEFDGGANPDAAVGEKEHLLLTEVKTTGGGVEFIEIYNPSSGTINLSDYYLSDTQQYAFLPGATGAGPAPDVTNNDFIARFPNGADIESGGILTIAIRPNGFEQNFGVSPDFRIGGNGNDMREGYPNSIGSLASLTDSGEGVALFHWDGASDLVTDVDLVDVGPNTSDQNALPNKTGSGLDGPDDGRDESTYKSDLSNMTNIGQSLEFGESFQRLLPETDRETQTGNGNGQHGHDETTEDVAATWAPAMATPGSVAAGL